MRTVFAMAILLTTSSHSLADEGSFEYLYDLCLQSAPFCLGYVSGVGHVMGLIGYAGLQRGFSICTGQLGPTRTAMVQAVVNYGREHPEIWSDGMLTSTMTALKASWPCPLK